MGEFAFFRHLHLYYECKTEHLYMQMLPYGQIILSNTNANVQNDRMQMLLKIANANIKIRMLPFVHQM